MINLRQELKKLTGKTLHSLSRRRPFDVLSVELYEIEIYVRSSGKEHHIALTEIEPAWFHLSRQGELTRSKIQERWSPRNPA